MKKRFIKAISVPIMVVLLIPIVVITTIKWVVKGGKTISDYIEDYMDWLSS